MEMFSSLSNILIELFILLLRRNIVTTLYFLAFRGFIVAFYEQKLRDFKRHQ